VGVGVHWQPLLRNILHFYYHADVHDNFMVFYVMRSIDSVGLGVVDSQ
jgi:hypothetical protein